MSSVSAKVTGCSKTIETPFIDEGRVRSLFSSLGLIPMRSLSKSLRAGIFFKVIILYTIRRIEVPEMELRTC